MFVCQECGHKFKTVAGAERASYHGCPGCGGSDIDVAPATAVSPRAAAVRRAMERRAAAAKPAALSNDDHHPTGWAERPMGAG